MTSVIDSLPPGNEKNELMSRLFQPFAQQLLQIAVQLKDTNEPIFKERDLNSEKARPVRLLYRSLEKMIIIVKYLTPCKNKGAQVTKDEQEHALVLVLRELWPLIQGLMIKYYNEEGLTENINKFIKHSMRCLNLLFGPFVEPYFKIIVDNYQVEPNPNLRKSQSRLTFIQ